MKEFKRFRIFSPYVVGSKESSSGASTEELKEMSFAFASVYAEKSVGKQILEKGSVLMHNEKAVVACCVATSEDDIDSYFIVVTPGADGEFYWVQNLDFVEVNELSEGIEKNK